MLRRRSYWRAQGQEAQALLQLMIYEVRREAPVARFKHARIKIGSGVVLGVDVFEGGLACSAFRSPLVDSLIGKDLYGQDLDTAVEEVCQELDRVMADEGLEPLAGTPRDRYHARGRICTTYISGLGGRPRIVHIF